MVSDLVTLEFFIKEKNYSSCPQCNNAVEILCNFFSSNSLLINFVSYATMLLRRLRLRKKRGGEMIR